MKIFKKCQKAQRRVYSIVLSMVGSWREVYKAYREGMIFVLGPKEKRMIEGKPVSGGTEL